MRRISTMRRPRAVVLAAFLAIALPSAALAADDLGLVTDEAEAALAILSAQASGGKIRAAAWERLLTSEGYSLLQRREASMKRPFTDDDFRVFLTARRTVAAAPALARVLTEWKARSPTGAAALAHAYLPPDTPLRARVVMVVKPSTNSFVFRADGASVVFLHLDPEQTPARFENTLGHELHHVGLDTACPEPPAGTYPPEVALARSFLGAFGEGFAMLAAAGGPDVHPHAVGSAQDRARWDRDVRRFDSDLRAVERFLEEILAGRLADEDQAFAAARPFWGAQGAWYTVGWRMAVMIEKRFGRARLIRDECDPVALLDDYNAAALAGAARWSEATLRRLARRAGAEGGER